MWSNISMRKATQVKANRLHPSSMLTTAGIPLWKTPKMIWRQSRIPLQNQSSKRRPRHRRKEAQLVTQRRLLVFINRMCQTSIPIGRNFLRIRDRKGTSSRIASRTSTRNLIVYLRSSHLQYNPRQNRGLQVGEEVRQRWQPRMLRVFPFLQRV